MELKDLDTSKFVIDPKIINDFDDFQEHYSDMMRWQEFAWIHDNKDGIDSIKTLKYITIMYDRTSDLRNKIENISQRKSMAAKMAGFKKKINRYSRAVEDMLTGCNEEVNALTARYCRFQGGSDWQLLVAYEVKLDSLSKSLLSDDEKVKDTVAAIRMIREDIDVLRNKIVSGDVSKLVVENLYNLIEEEKLKLRPEDIAKIRETGNIEFTEYNKEPELITPILNKINPSEEGN